MIDNLEKIIRKACKPVIGMPLAMSGGIDSSVLAAIIKPKFGITVVSPGGEAYNEYKYTKKVAKHLGIKLIVVKTKRKEFLEEIRDAIRAVGTVTPHFNIYPLYKMYQTLHEMGERDIVIADGPDESMSGYARNLIVNYLYGVYDFEAFKPYKELIDRILPPAKELYSKITGVSNPPKGKYKGLIQYMNRIDMEYKRPEMDVMGNQIAKYFDINIHKPYEKEMVDEYMFRLPDKFKIYGYDYGKYALRWIADKYLPKEIAWRKVKRGGPIFPVNKMMEWDTPEFDKEDWIRFQREVLNG